jgi:hypothetical protein
MNTKRTGLKNAVETRRRNLDLAQGQRLLESGTRPALVGWHVQVTAPRRQSTPGPRLCGNTAAKSKLPPRAGRNPDGFRAIGTIGAVVCMLLFTYNKRPAAGRGRPRDGCQPLPAEDRMAPSAQLAVNCCIHVTCANGRRCAPVDVYRGGGTHRWKWPMPASRPDCQNGRPQRNDR